MSQVNFTVGVRGSISTIDFAGRDDRWIRSFTSSLRLLGVTRQADINRTCKLVAKRIFEAHDLMLRSYYAAVPVGDGYFGNRLASNMAEARRNLVRRDRPPFLP